MKRSTTILLWLGFLLIFLIPFLWYSGSKEIIIGGDLTFPLHPGEYLSSIFQIWRRVYAGGNSAISLTTVPFYLPMAIFDWLGFSLQTVQKLHFGLWLAVPALSMFYLSGIIFKDHPRRLVAQLAAVTVYIFNTYEVVWADSARMAVWVGMPLLLAFFINGLKDTKRWWRWSAAIALASITVSTTTVNPPMFLVLLAVFVFWLIYHFFTTPEDRNFLAVRRIALFILLSLTLAVLINMFWLVPYAHVLVGEYRGALSSGLAGIQFQDWLGPVSTNTSLLNVFRLQGAWDWYAGWQGEPYVPAATAYQNNPFYLFWSLLVPIVSFSALLLKQDKVKKPLILLFASIALAGLFFGAGSHEPTGKIYKFLIDHLPFLSIYRSPWYKFSTWTVLGYSLLSAVTIAWLADRLSSLPKKLSHWAMPAQTLLVLLFIGGTLLYSSGIVFGKVFPKKSERIRLHSAHVTFPDYFHSAADWINQQPGDWRILQLPAQQAFNYNWGLGTLMDMTIFTFKQPTLWWPEQTGSGGAKAGSESLVKETYDQIYYGSPLHISRVLGMLNVRYLLEKEDIDFAFYGGSDSAPFVKDKLTKLGFPLAKQEGPWDFFEVKSEDQRPLIAVANRLVETDQQIKGIFAAAASPLFAADTTYTDQPTKLPAAVVRDYQISPDLKKAQLKDNQLVLPVNAPVTAQYSLSFSKAESATITMDSTPIPLTLSGDHLEGTVELTAGEHQLKISLTGGYENLINNPSFEMGLWEPEPLDATRLKPGEPKLSATIVNDASDGKQSTKIASKNHSAALRRGIDQFDAQRSYLLSFDYKYITGNTPKFGLWQEGSFITEPAGELDRSTEWKNYSTVFRPRPFTKGANLFLYADPGEQLTETTALYDNVSAIKLPELLDSLSLTTRLATPGALPKITYERITTSQYRVTVTDAASPYFLNFLEQYDDGWELNLPNSSQNHFESFGYANGWRIDKAGSYTIDIIFKPQLSFYKAAIVSTAGLLITLALLFLANRKRLK